MDELRGPTIQIVLHIREGIGFGFVKSPFIVSGSLNGYMLETDPALPCHAPAFDAELVWEADKKRFRNLRVQNVPIKVEVYTTGTQGRKSKVGYLLLSLLSAQPCPGGKTTEVKYTWHRLLGVKTEGKCCQPQIMMSLSIEDRTAVPTPRNELRMFHATEAAPSVAAAPPGYIAKTVNEYKAESGRVPASPALAPRLLPAEGVVAVGEGRALLALGFVIAAVENVDVLLPECDDSSKETNSCFITYSVFSQEIMTDKVVANVHKDTRPSAIFNQKTTLRLKTNLKCLGRYFQECPLVVIKLCSGEKDLGVCSVDLRKLVPTDDAAHFREGFCDAGGAFTVNERCFLLPCEGATVARKPYLDVEMSLRYIEDCGDAAPPLTTRSATQLAAPPPPPAPAPYKSDSCTNLGELSAAAAAVDRWERSHEPPPPSPAPYNSDSCTNLGELSAAAAAVDRWERSHEPPPPAPAPYKSDSCTNLGELSAAAAAVDRWERSHEPPPPAPAPYKSDSCTNLGELSAAAAAVDRWERSHEPPPPSPAPYNSDSCTNLGELSAAAAAVDRWERSHEPPPPAPAPYKSDSCTNLGELSAAAAAVDRWERSHEPPPPAPAPYKSDSCTNLGELSAAAAAVDRWERSHEPPPPAPAPFKSDSCTNLGELSAAAAAVDRARPPTEEGSQLSELIRRMCETLERGRTTSDQQIQCRGMPDCDEVGSQTELKTIEEYTSTDNKVQEDCENEVESVKNDVKDEVKDDVKDEVKEDFKDEVKDKPTCEKLLSEKELAKLAMSPRAREAVMNQYVEELETWKERQQTLYKIQLQRKEAYHLQRLAAEWGARRATLEARLRAGVEQCRHLAAALAAFTDDMRARASKLTQLRSAKQALEQHYRAQYAALREAARRAEDDARLQLHAAGARERRLQDTVAALERQLAEAQNNLRNLEEQAENKYSGLTKDQTASLIQELRCLEEKLDNATQSKAFFKEQWGRAVRELHLLKHDTRKQMLSQLRDERRLLAGAESVGGGGGGGGADTRRLRDECYVELLAAAPLVPETDNGSNFDGMGMINELCTPKSPMDEKLAHLSARRDELVRQPAPDEDELRRLNHEIRGILLNCGV